MKKFDLHLHSKYSGDNYSEPEEMVEAAIRAGLDGMVFTEHDSYDASEPIEPLIAKYRNRITILRGCEFSTKLSHTLVYGISKEIGVPLDAPIDILIKEVKHMGGVAIPAHPFRWGIGDGLIKVKGVIAIETCNGLNYPDYNEMAVTLAETMGVSATGGSDAHDPEGVGRAYTEFDADEVTADNIAALLLGGRYRAVLSEAYNRYHNSYY